LLDGVANRRAKPLHESTPTEAREAMGWFDPGDGPSMFSVVDETVETTDGQSFPIRVLTPTVQPRGTVVYYHGGGWVLGDIDAFDTLARTLAHAANVRVVLVGYRLAPENPYPAAVDDSWQALEWVAAQRKVWGHAPIVLAGDSAGGNLAIATAVRAAAERELVSAVLLVYPVTDTDTTRPSYVDPDNQLLISKRSMEWFLTQYVDDASRADPRVSPVRYGDLSGFPPTAVILAEHDPLRDEGEEFADLLVSAGVSVRRSLFHQQMHGFFQMINVLPASNAAIKWLAEYLDTTVFKVRQEIE
jgi:acetyl esterase